MEIKRDALEFSNFYARLLYNDDINIMVIIFSGSLDKEAVLKFRKKVERKVVSKKFNFIIDLNHITYISSTGLGFLMYLSKYSNQFIFLSFPPEVIQKPFKLLEMDEYFLFYSNPDELITRANIPEAIVQALKEETSIVEIHYNKRWMNILRGYVQSHEEMMKEIDRMSDYIHQADHEDTLTIPSEEKYSAILYKYLHRILRKEAGISTEEIDNTLVELIAKELITNAVKHGYNYDKNGVIEICYSIDNKQLLIAMTDYGKGFASPRPSHDLFPSAGLKLLDRIFDRVEIGKAAKKKVQGLVLGKGTHVRLTKYLKPPHLRNVLFLN
ncbi:MAG: STAS domain-containing protein [Candidatus Cloacimonadota bacterium]|nr:MAG: STAS domain-containing protein [Candidatus Cloacimonadota bacterium]